MNGTPKEEILDFTVVVVSWNACDLLRKCLKSIEADFPAERGEVIVVDNASRDGSAEMIAEDFPQFVLIRNHSNDGFAKGNNIALTRSRGKLIFLINSDTEVMPGTYESFCRFMEQDKQIGLAGPTIVGPDGEIQRSCMGYPTLWRLLCSMLAIDSVFPKSKLFSGYMMRWFDHKHSRQVDVVNGCFWVVRREAFEKVGMLDENFFMYGEDIDWCRRFTLSGYKVFFVHTIKTKHFGGGSSRNSPVRFYVEMYRANLRYWRKYHNLGSTVCYWMVIVCHQGVRFFVRILQYPFFFGVDKENITYKIKRSLACLLFLFGLLKPNSLEPQPEKSSPLRKKM